MSDFICQKYTDCSSCSHYQKQIFKYRSFPKGMMIPKERCSQNTIYFLISGSVRVTSDEHPDTVFHDGQFIMQPIGSRVEFHILESTECILYLFETPQNICTDRFNKGLELAKESPMLPVVMDMCFPLRLFINGLKMYLNNELLCVEFLKAKQTELYFLLNCYYTLKEIAYFYAPIYRYSQTFRYFVMQNYLKAFGQDGNNWMEIDDLAKGLPDDLFDFILFDACYMASVECTYELRNKAEYILASPTETMADGWPYEEMMPQLFATDLQLEKVGETFYNHYLNNTYPYATVSLTKTSELDNLKSVTHDILADKTESDIYSLDPKKMQRLEYLYRSPGMLYDFNDYIKQLATAEQYDRFISCLDKAVVYKAHTPKSYYAAIGNALPIKSYCGLTIFVPQESLPKMLEWYKQRVGWYKAVYE